MSSSPQSVAEDAASRRRSGRVKRKPEFLAPEPTTNTKRKRADAEDEDQIDDDEDMEESESDPEEDEEPAEEEVRDKRKARAAPKKSAAKKPKTNGAPSTLPIRNTTTKPRSRKKKVQALDMADAEEAGGLYTEVFARGHTLDDAVAEWLKEFDQNESRAVADLVNFVLRSAGCALQVTQHNVEDPDGATNTLGDLQEEFQAQNVTDYPIISKSKGTAAFKASVTGFFNTLIKATAGTGILFTNVELIENIQVWLSAMSAAQNRPFRHTATVVSLAIVTALCEAGRDLLSVSAKALRHSESEKKSKKVNKGRVSGIQEDAQRAQQKQALLDTLVKDWFDTIFIHRYRDIDPKIRVDCAQALGDWILTYPDVFFDGSHLRYLGWVLSDSYAPARHEVINQLQRLYDDKDRLAGLKTFTERFRARIVEMATLDSEAGVRAAAVKLLDSLRDAGFLEPSDIDAIGRLVFDAEPRVRKAVTKFFKESINDAYELKIEDLGGEEAIEEDLGDAATSSEKPNLDWLRLKCLAEMLDSYDAADLPPDVEHGPGQDNYRLHAGLIESRFIVAADSLYNEIPIIQDWETIAGFLLYDISDGGQNGVAHGIEAQLNEMVKLDEKEEIVLLEVLNASVKGEVARLVEAPSEKKGKKTKKQRDDVADEQEHAARQLTNLIPRLLKRFGDVPQTASAVLRLERIVNLEAFEDFSQDTSTYSRLLDDINRQFLTHGNEEVLTEASRALLRAKDYQDLGDVTEEKIDALWEDTISTFVSLTGGHDLTSRGNLPDTAADALSKTVSRIERLTSISRPIAHLETTPTASKPSRKTKGKATEQPARPFDSLIALIERGVVSKHSPDAAEPTIEDSLALHAASAVSFYLLWTISELRTAFESTTSNAAVAQVENFTQDRDAYVKALGAVLTSRGSSDSISPTIAGFLLDAHTVTATLRQFQRTGDDDDPVPLAIEMDSRTQKSILRVFGACEESFAKKTSRKLEGVDETKPTAREEEDEEDINAEPMDEDEPLASSDEDAASSPDEDDPNADSNTQSQNSQVRKTRKMQAQLIAEQRLCELTGKIVLAVLAGMMDGSVTRKRVERNRNRLGNNFKEVVKHLDGEATKGKGSKKGVATKAKTLPVKESKKSEAVVVESDEEDEDEDEDEEEVPLVEEVEDEDPVEEQDGDQEVESVLGD